MANGRHFYWAQVDEDTFFGDEFDFLAQQERGGDYIALYLAMRLISLNSGGWLMIEIGDKQIPLTPAQIARKCNGWYDAKFVSDALALYEDLELIDRDGDFICINRFRVGSETDYAQKKRKQRGKDGKGDNVPHNVPHNVPQSNSIEQEPIVKRDTLPPYHDSDNVVVVTLPQRQQTIDEFVMEAVNMSFGAEHRDKMAQYKSQLGDDVIRYAVDRMLENGVKKWVYLENVLDGYLQKGLTTMQAVEAHETARKAAKAKKQAESTPTPKRERPYNFV